MDNRFLPLIKDVEGFIFDFNSMELNRFTVDNIPISDEKTCSELNQLPLNNVLFQHILSYLYSEYTSFDFQGKQTTKGFPDFVLVHNKTGEELFVELKSEKDGLRMDQLSWFFNNPKKKRIIIWITKVTNSLNIKELNKKLKNTEEQ